MMKFSLSLTAFSRKRLEIAAQKPQEVVAAADTRRRGGVAVPDEAGGHQLVDPAPVPGVDLGGEVLDYGFVLL